jgi:hypothetical protein
MSFEYCSVCGGRASYECSHCSGRGYEPTDDATFIENVREVSFSFEEYRTDSEAEALASMMPRVLAVIDGMKGI